MRRRKNLLCFSTLAWCIRKINCSFTVPKTHSYPTSPPLQFPLADTQIKLDNENMRFFLRRLHSFPRFLTPTAHIHNNIGKNIQYFTLLKRKALYFPNKYINLKSTSCIQTICYFGIAFRNLIIKNKNFKTVLFPAAVGLHCLCDPVHISSNPKYSRSWKRIRNSSIKNFKKLSFSVDLV